MERAAGFVHDDTPQAKLDKLDAVLAQTSTRIEDAALFAEMLSLPNDGRYPALDLTPEPVLLIVTFRPEFEPPWLGNVRSGRR
jgi:hypothetical protein